jgi:internalin A
MKTLARMAAVVLILASAVSVRADEDAAVRAIESLGGKVTRDDKAPGKPVVKVVLSGSRVTDAGLKELKQLKQINSLELSFCKEVTDAGLKELKELKQLKELNLLYTKVTAAGVADLKKALPDLKITR